MAVAWSSSGGIAIRFDFCVRLCIVKGDPWAEPAMRHCLVPFVVDFILIWLFTVVNGLWCDDVMMCHKETAYSLTYPKQVTFQK